jgi:uncharacterized protein
MQPITIRYAIQLKRRSLMLAEVSDLFGLNEDEPPITIAENFQIEPKLGQIILFTGPSGSGKSSLLRAISEQVNALDAMSLSLPEVPLIEALPGSLKERLDHLTACGLAEARILLRLPSELSEGQRYRFRLALALATNSSGWLQADEFTATLDRTLAKVVAFNLCRRIDRQNQGILLATTHEDIVDDLQPDLWIRCHGEGRIEVILADATLKKNGSSLSMTSFGSVKVPEATGRTSLAGIIAAMPLASSKT